jgi:hypothetical protein
MDYTPAADHLAKWQWEIIRYPALFTDPFGGDEEGMVYSISTIKNLFNLIKTNNTKTYPSSLSSGTIVRAIDIYQENYIRDSAQNVSMTKEEFLSTLTHEQTESFAQRETTDKAWDNNPITLANKAHVKLKIDDKADSVEFIISMNGYSATDKIFTTWIWTEENKNRMVFYNAIYKKENATIIDVKNNRKSFDIIVHEFDGFGTFEELKMYFKIKGVIDFSDTLDTSENEIILELSRKRSNDFVTIGELKIKGTEIKFITLELGKDINGSSTTSCSEENHIQYKCGRIKSGTYNFTLTRDEGSATQHHYKSLRLDNVPNRTGILVHRGYAYSWTRGCILLMIANEIDNVLDNPDQFMVGETQGFNSDVEYQVPVLALYDYIEQYSNNNIVKKIIITDDDENISDNVAFTKEINYRREAARLYFDNKELINNILDNTIDSLMKEYINQIIHYELCSDGEHSYPEPLLQNIVNINSIIQRDNFKAKVMETIIRNNVVSMLTIDLIKLKLTQMFAIYNNSNDQQKIIEKFFRNGRNPSSPIKLISDLYKKNDRNEFGSALTVKVNQNNIDTYIEECKNEIIENLNIN